MTIQDKNPKVPPTDPFSAAPAGTRRAAGPISQAVAAATQAARAASVRAEPVLKAAGPAALADIAPAPAPKALPQDFVTETEHPVLPIPFTVFLGEHKLEGKGISVAAAYAAIGGALDPSWRGHRDVVRLQFDFAGFSVTLTPEIVVAGSRKDGEMTLQFREPAGSHLPQLRYIINTYIAGDFVSMNGMMSYTGPTTPKAAKSEAGHSKPRLRSAAVVVLSLTMLVAAANFMIKRVTQSYEPRPVFVERAGKEMKATTAGQISFLNPQAKKGEVAFAINANTGDVLNFALPCDCEVTVTEGVFEGATVLPFDTILSFFDTNVAVSVQTQMSIEGLGKVMDGERAYVDLNDGRTVAVRVVTTSATNSANMRGDLFVPVRLLAAPGVLTADDIGKSGRLRLVKPLIPGSSAYQVEKQ
jgi:hypothetical protein